MKTIRQSYEVIEQGLGHKALLKHIELCARVSYKSEDRITDDSAAAFVGKLIGNRHMSPLEHGTVCLKIDGKVPRPSLSHIRRYGRERWVEYEDMLYITTNYRAIEESDAADLLMSYETLFDEKRFDRRVSVRIVTNRAIANEFVRHRAFSFTQESTRWVNYSKGRHGGELVFITPNFLVESDNERKGLENAWRESMLYAEGDYLDLIKNYGLRAEEARGALPLDTKTELVMTGFVADWMRFFDQRCSKTAHPQAREIANGLREEFVRRGYITDEEQ